MADLQQKAKTGIDSAADHAKAGVDKGAHMLNQANQPKQGGGAESIMDRASGVVDQVKHRAESAVDAVGDFAHDAKHKAQHYAEDAYDMAGDRLGTLNTDVTELVKKYPIQALLVGFGVGMLLGRASRA